MRKEKNYTFRMNDGKGGIVTTKISHADAVAIVDKIVVAPTRDRRAFFESPDFNRIMDLFSAVAKRGVLSQEDVVYAKPGKYPFTADEFRKAVESVLECVPATEAKSKHGTFPVYTAPYKGLEFSVMTGQGSTYFVKRQPSIK